MIYFYSKDITSEEFTGKKAVLLAASLSAQEEDLDTSADFITVPELFAHYKKEGVFLKIAFFPEVEVPFIVLDTSVSGFKSEDCCDVSDAFYFVESAAKKIGSVDFSKEHLSKISSIINERYQDKEKTSAAIAASITQVQYAQGSSKDLACTIGVDLIDQDLVKISTKALGELNKANAGMFTSITSAENITLFQAECTDTLFLELPTRAVLQEEENVSVLIPKRQSVCIPYDIAEAYSVDYKTQVPSYLWPKIEGNTANNKLGILPNEQKFYNALLEWMHFGVLQEFDTDDGKILDSISQEFLTELLTEIYAWHWRHIPSMPFILDELTGDQDSGNVEQISSRYSFRESRSGERYRNALLVMQEFVNEASIKLGYKVYADAIVKLARWGTRKCTALVLDDYEWVLDLATAQKRRNIGSITDYTVQLVNGCTCSLTAILYDDTKIIAKDACTSVWEMPVGVETTTELLNEKDERLSLKTYYSMIDFIRCVRDDGLKVFGVNTLETEWKFTSCDIHHWTSEILSQYQNNKNKFLQNPFFRSSELQDVYLEMKAYSSNGSQNHFSLMQLGMCFPNLKMSFENSSFHNVEELKKKLETGKIINIASAIDANVVSVLYPIYAKVSSQWQESMTLEECVALWESSMREVGYNSESDFLRKEYGSDESNLVEQATPVQAFGADNTNAGKQKEDRSVSLVTETSTQTRKISLLKSIPPGSKFVQLDNDNGEIVGGYATDVISCRTKTGALKEVHRFCFVTKEYVANIPSEDLIGVCKLKKMLANFLQTFCLIESGCYSAITTYFLDLPTMKYYRDLLIVREEAEI